jgi:hypothetical protein
MLDRSCRIRQAPPRHFGVTQARIRFNLPYTGSFGFAFPKPRIPAQWHSFRVPRIPGMSIKIFATNIRPSLALSRSGGPQRAKRA